MLELGEKHLSCDVGTHLLAFASSSLNLQHFTPRYPCGCCGGCSGDKTILRRSMVGANGFWLVCNHIRFPLHHQWLQSM